MLLQENNAKHQVETCAVFNVQCCAFAAFRIKPVLCFHFFFLSFLYPLSTLTDFRISFDFESTIGIVFFALCNIIYANEWSTIVSCHIYFIGSVVVTASPVQSLLYRFRSHFLLHSSRVRIFFFHHHFLSGFIHTIISCDCCVFGEINLCICAQVCSCIVQLRQHNTWECSCF